MRADSRSAAQVVSVLALWLGGGSLLLFAAFLVAGPFRLIRLGLAPPQALGCDALLSAVFFLQHSGMVRAPFRTRLASRIPEPFHPAVYAIASGLALSAVVLLWQPSTTILAEVQGLWRLPFWAAVLGAAAGFAWGVSTIGEFDPFGQLALRAHLERREPATRLVVRGPYCWVRHPLYLFMLVFIWATPRLTVDRLLFNVLWTLWLVLGTWLEERDLAAAFGESYRRYQRVVPMLIPWRGPVGKSLPTG